jgi:hypothetical protein
MLEKFRPFVILLTMLAFSTANMAWAIDGAAMALGSEQGHHHSVRSAHSNQSHSHPDSKQIAEHPDCTQGMSAGCHTGQHSGDLAKSCCGAIACHAAIPATGCATTITPLVRAIQPLPFEFGVKQASVARLDRPPRSPDL